MRNTGPARFFIPVGIILIIFGIIMMTFNNGSYLETVPAAGPLGPGAQDRISKLCIGRTVDESGGKTT